MTGNGSTADDSTERKAWIRCESCGGSGHTPWFRGNSGTINHLARGGDSTRLPCGDCQGRGQVWGTAPERPSGRL